jgi:hypothetical protein
MRRNWLFALVPVLALVAGWAALPAAPAHAAAQVRLVSESTSDSSNNSSLASGYYKYGKYKYGKYKYGKYHHNS